MQTLILRVEYDGAGFCGWQYQPDKRTVQGVIEKTLSGICGYQVGIMGAGRTDTGVHARGQVAHAVLKKPFPARGEKTMKSINANLPGDIRINGVAIVMDEFHSRFDACAREYSYHLIDKPSVFLSHFAAYFKYPYKPQKMQQAAEIFLGRHDFTAFSKNNPETKSHICDVQACEWEKKSTNYWQLRIKANRFLYGMVRTLVGTMTQYARGKITLDDINRTLVERKRNNLAPLAPPNGLILEKIYYPPEKTFLPAFK